MKALIIAERLPEAADIAERLADDLDSPKFYLRAASIRAQLQQWEQATNILARGLTRFSASQELSQALAEVGNRGRKATEPNTAKAQAAANV